ncbi:glutamine-synthetase adenylyltransferase [Syntrophotalea acetylenivorans]|uniref:Glutamine-synthetase adenylyltransferase n=1 Tax=Syntrophotalea acetylenivorans TaxID=1842532 RepID=A0A1L3GSH7_9BACT|nr:bifunctional [glutamate--ammonia ligase]-adenylyl-L-tyrosine phosphorylase/[glutamate--ammonia-ligase] adenylyltransferase [Syntrophotalea acetylenivorans]APG28893.1 glutamine-synthetase adenylyltransferase [Syntrophotalea acetylenivorans]
MGPSFPTAQLSDTLGKQDQAGLATLLAACGYQEPDKSAANLLLLQEHGLSEEQLIDLTRSALASAAPDQAINSLERLASGLNNETLDTLLSKAACLEVLLTVLGASQFLATILFRHNSLLDSLFLHDDYCQAKDHSAMLAELQQRIPPGSSFEDLQKGLRHFKQQEILRIATRDLTGLADLTVTTAELSDLASATLQRSYQICDELLRERFGAPLLGPDSGQPGSEAKFTVLAMGKFGGGELNFSSDIDLIYCYSCEQGETAGIADGDTVRNRISLHQYFVKLGEKINQAMHQVTADGFVFRVDLRLRPEGRSGEIASSLRSTESYYEHWGQSWERSAMLKARPVAGCVDFGWQLLQNLEPFIYRRYLDYTMIDDLKVMKQKIDNNLTREREGELNLKLGRGGIREIEFFIQALQIIHAGKNPALREKNSLRALTLLQSHGLIDAETTVILSEAYTFLRTVEHRIQVVQERQTHNLPTDEIEFERLGRRCGFTDCAEFRQILESYRREVSAIYHDLFYTSEEEADAVPAEVAYLFDPAAEPAELQGLLKAKGFTDPVGACDTLTALRDGPPRHPLSPQARRHFNRLAPMLLCEVIALPEPDMAFRNLERFLGALRARATFFALLAENRPLIKLLVSLFGTSQFLSRILIQHPGTLDFLVAVQDSDPEKARDRLEADLAKHFERAGDYEEKLDALRCFRNEELLRVALGDIRGNLSLQQGPGQLTLLAEICLQQATAMARNELLPRYGLPTCQDAKGNTREAAFAIVALGKLGGRELNYHSDLDIIFIYEDLGQTQAAANSDPALFRVRSNQEYFSRLAQRIISILSLITGEGCVYQIDTRLRPSGQQGPLVTSFPAFRAYHQQSAQLWERQALIKARVVVGPPPFAQRISDLQQEIVFGRPLPPDSRQEIYHLRQRMEKELGREDRSHYNIKTGRGGLVDIEFLVQYLQLLHGSTDSSLRSPNTLEALQALQQTEHLDDQETRLLADGYLYLRRLENKLRLVHDQSINQLSSEMGYLAKLAHRLDYAGDHPEEQLLADYRQTTEKIRGIFDRYLTPS